ncbi:MAG: hypothetical protein JWN15_2057, partial [Firmicutes bacterium]|nr:hypothetical protein [Bacillota bacterium]
MANASMMPASILLAPNLSPAAKIIWACHRPEESSAPSTNTLVGRSSLTPATVRRALAELSGGDWLASRSQISGNAVQPHVTMPIGLLADTDLDLQAKLLYGAARKLALTGWLDLSQENRASPIEFTLGDPVAERWGIMIAQMGERLHGL